ncbi:hypothetical protein GDO81_024142 [Engystomops pustulosus]|uniref:Uncharacterized protein n=1 Tax=Engystomops pustulosus TaxID=76066 RepID=A0AAV6ZNA9_ENGPU|nr:hypothetical protein GDO81_024142 [Engystomops pustulosus]
MKGSEQPMLTRPLLGYDRLSARYVWWVPLIPPPGARYVWWVPLILLHGISAEKEPGKFDLVYEGEDGADVVEYAVPPEYKILQAWSSLIDPRLVTEPLAVAPGP